MRLKGPDGMSTLQTMQAKLYYSCSLFTIQDFIPGPSKAVIATDGHVLLSINTILQLAIPQFSSVAQRILSAPYVPISRNAEILHRTVSVQSLTHPIQCCDCYRTYSSH